MAPKWNFEYTGEKMDDKVLADYQTKLIQLRDHYEKFFSEMKGCSFYPEKLPLPPPDNIFARFGYTCKIESHKPHSCHGWHLVWNPNIEKDPSKLVFKSRPLCAPTKYKILCKTIQSEIQLKFFHYFKLFYMDSDVDFYKMSESYHDVGVESHMTFKEKQKSDLEDDVMSLCETTEFMPDYNLKQEESRRRRRNSTIF